MEGKSGFQAILSDPAVEAVVLVLPPTIALQVSSSLPRPRVEQLVTCGFCQSSTRAKQVPLISRRSVVRECYRQRFELGNTLHGSWLHSSGILCHSQTPEPDLTLADLNPDTQVALVLIYYIFFNIYLR